MRRADRLFQIIQFIRRHRVTTAADLARALEVSERTVYRDIRDLVISGVPIEGEAGVGYLLREGFDLPPLMFTEAEVEALVLGTRVVMSWADPALGSAAAAALARVEAALPENLRDRLQGSRLYAPGFHVPPAVVGRLGRVREALDARHKVHLGYTDAAQARTERNVRPLGLFFWGWSWSVTAWCELRNDFRNFRLDRATDVEVLPERFEDEPGKTLDVFLKLMETHEPSSD